MNSSTTVFVSSVELLSTMRISQITLWETTETATLSRAFRRLSQRLKVHRTTDTFILLTGSCPVRSSRVSRSLDFDLSAGLFPRSLHCWHLALALTIGFHDFPNNLPNHAFAIKSFLATGRYQPLQSPYGEIGYHHVWNAN